MKVWLYVLHFDQPVNDRHPAQHYTGACGAITERLIRHAHGRAARLTQVCLERGIEWQLAGLWRASVKSYQECRKLEMRAKSHTAERHCHLCSDEVWRIKGATEIDLAMIEECGIPLRSEAIREKWRS